LQHSIENVGPRGVGKCLQLVERPFRRLHVARTEHRTNEDGALALRPRFVKPLR
jgi:hypothetical protein